MRGNLRSRGIEDVYNLLPIDAHGDSLANTNIVEWRKLVGKADVERVWIWLGKKQEIGIFINARHIIRTDVGYEINVSGLEFY